MNSTFVHKVEGIVFATSMLKTFQKELNQINLLLFGVVSKSAAFEQVTKASLNNATFFREKPLLTLDGRFFFSSASNRGGRFEDATTLEFGHRNVWISFASFWLISYKAQGYNFYWFRPFGEGCKPISGLLRHFISLHGVQKSLKSSSMKSLV